jgi:hypothetical protein
MAQELLEAITERLEVIPSLHGPMVRRRPRLAALASPLATPDRPGEFDHGSERFKDVPVGNSKFDGWVPSPAGCWLPEAETSFALE